MATGRVAQPAGLLNEVIRLPETEMCAAQTIFGTTQAAAHAVNSYLPAHKFALWPYNRFRPEDTDWWFFTPNKGEEWPAYRYSKLCLAATPHDPPRLFAGLHIEKGLGEPLSHVPGVERKYLMAKSWFWHRFVEEAKRWGFDSALRDVLNRSANPVYVSVDAIEFHKLSEPDQERQPPDE
jgi:hypothetical protein